MQDIYLGNNMILNVVYILWVTSLLAFRIPKSFPKLFRYRRGGGGNLRKSAETFEWSPELFFGDLRYTYDGFWQLFKIVFFFQKCSF